MSDMPLFSELSLLSKALGFLSMALRNDPSNLNCSLRALKLAALIQEFCHDTKITQKPSLKSLRQTFPRWFGNTAMPQVLKGPSFSPSRSVLIFPAMHLRQLQAINDNSRREALLTQMSACLNIGTTGPRLH